MILITVITTCILTLILAISIYDFYSLLLREENIISKKMLILSISIYFGISVSMNFLKTSFEFNMIITYISLSVIAFNYKANVVSKLFSAFLGMVGMLGFEMIAVHMVGGIVGQPISILINDTIVFTIMFALARFIPYVILKTVKIIFLKKNTKRGTNHKWRLEEWGIVITLPLFSLILMYLIYRISESLIGAINYYSTASILLILLLNIIFYSVYCRILKLIEIETMLILQEQQNQYYSTQYDELKLNLEEVRQFKHDVKHIFLNSITEFSEISNIPIGDVLIHKVDRMIEDLYLETYKCYTGISSVDMILNYQMNRAKKHEIELLLQIQPNINVNMEGRELVIILGNVLENAIEACIVHNKKEIEIYILNKNDNFYISISNEYEGEIRYNNELPITSKDNPQIHGMGLNNIKELVKSNNGNFSIITENNKFIVEILLVNE